MSSSLSSGNVNINIGKGSSYRSQAGPTSGLSRTGSTCYTSSRVNGNQVQRYEPPQSSLSRAPSTVYSRAESPRSNRTQHSYAAPPPSMTNSRLTSASRRSSTSCYALEPVSSSANSRVSSQDFGGSQLTSRTVGPADSASNVSTIRAGPLLGSYCPTQLTRPSSVVAPSYVSGSGSQMQMVPRRSSVVASSQPSACQPARGRASCTRSAV